MFVTTGWKEEATDRRPGLLLNIIQCIGQSSQQRITFAKISIAKVEESWARPHEEYRSRKHSLMPAIKRGNGHACGKSTLFCWTSSEELDEKMRQNPT